MDCLQWSHLNRVAGGSHDPGDRLSGSFQAEFLGPILLFCIAMDGRPLQCQTKETLVCLEISSQACLMFLKNYTHSLSASTALVIFGAEILLGAIGFIINAS